MYAKKMNPRVDKKHFKRDSMRGKKAFTTRLVRGGKRI